MRDPTSFLGYTSIPLLLTLLIAVPAAQSGGGGGDADPTVSLQAAPFRATDVDTVVGGDFRIGEILLERHRGAPGLDDVELDVLIATVPDPVESSLDWIFDTQVAAIRRALEEADYVIDRSWFPSPSDSITVVHAGNALRVPAGDEHPGVILFRDVDASRDRHLLVYLVGELPTGGVHRGALRAALDERAALLARAAEPRRPGDARDTVRVLGPTFSGSAESLRRTLDTWASEQVSLPGPVRFDIVTGSATSASVAELFRTRGAGDPAPATYEFGATVHSDSAYMATLESDVLAPLGVSTSEVAFLVEANTAYGRSLMRSGYMIVPFPTNIAAVREEYAENPEAAAARSGPEPVGASDARLPLSLSTMARARENPPTRSTLTPAALDLLLDEIVRTLQTHRVRALGIMATDVRDKLFLARVVKRRLRDIQLFTFESNVLFLRQDFSPSLRGMFVVSTYSLVAESQAWTDDGRSFLPFSHDASQGTFNATLMLLDRPDALVDYVPPVVAPEGGVRRPPVWITTVGRNVLLPVRALEIVDPYVAPAPADSDVERDDPHRPGLLVFVAFAVTALLIFVVARWARRKGDTPSAYSEVQSASWIAVLSVMAPLGPLTLINQPADSIPARATYATMSAVLLIGLVVTIVAHTFGMTRRWHDEEEWERGSSDEQWVPIVRLGHYAVPFAALALGLIGLSYALQVWGYYLEDPAGFEVYRFRVLRLDGGASPLLPLLLAALGVAGGHAWHVTRIGLLRERCPLERIRPPRIPGKEPWGPGLREAVRALGRIRDEFTRVAPRASSGLVVTITVPLLFVILPVAYGFRTVENLNFVRAGTFAPSNMIVSWTLLASLLTVLGSTFHLLRSWGAISEGLSALSKTPLLHAFSRIPDGVRVLGRLYLFDPPSVDRGRAVSRQVLAKLRGRVGSRWLQGESEEDDDPGTKVASRSEAWDPDVRRLTWSVVEQWRERPDTIELDAGVEPEVPDKELELLRAAETATAVEAVLFIGWTLRNLRRVTILLLASILLTTAVLVSFPTPVRGQVTVLFWLLMIASLGIVVMIAGHLSQDEVLSRVNGTAPGRITWNRASMLSVIVIVSLPILGLLAAEVPAVGRALFSWVDPVLRALINV